MANSSREALLHSAMDQLVSRVRKWKAGSGPVGLGQAQELCHKHKDDIYRCFQDSGLQAWEFHTMLHRAAEYGLVEDMQGLWSEVATTFLQMRSGYGAFEAPAQQPPMQQMQQAKANGAYGAAPAAYPANGRSSSNSSSNHAAASNGIKPPGLSRQTQQQQQQQQASTYTVAAANRSPQDDVAGTSTDQHSSRKQQQKQPGSRSSSVGKGGAAAGANQQQQSRGGAAAGKQQAAPAASAGNKAAATSAAAAAAAADAAASMPNGYISAWRNGLDAAAAAAIKSGSPALMAGFIGGPGGFHQQQRQPGMEGLQQQQGGLDQQQQQEEPLDLLPLGLLDDVYDQGDAVVDGPPKSKAAGGAVAGRAASQQQHGKQAGKQQQQGVKQRSTPPPQQQQARSQQQGKTAATGGNAAQQQQQQQAQSRGAAMPAANGNQQQPEASAGYDNVALNSQLSPAARPFPSPLALPSFASQAQQQQPPQLGYDLTSPLAGLQQRASLEALHQQQLLMLQQQARFYQQQHQQQQQQMGMWGSGPHMPYAMHPLGAPGVQAQPPPPPRNMAAGGSSSAAPGSGMTAAAASQAGAGAAAGGATQQQQQQQQAVKPGYAAIAAGLSAAPHASAAAAAPAGSGSDTGSSLGDVTHPPPPGGLSYRGSLGLGLVPSAAPGGPTGHLADHARQQPMGSASAAAGQSVPSAQQQQQGFPHGSLGSGADGFGHGSLLGPGSLMQQQQQGLMGLQQQPGSAGAGLVGGASLSSSGGSGKGLMPAGLSLFQGASYDSPLTGPLMGGNSSTGTAVGGGALSPYPSPMHRSLSGVPSGGASPALSSLAASGPQGSSNLGMAPMLLPPSALGAVGEPVRGSSDHAAAHTQQQQQQQAAAAPRTPAWGGAPGRAVAPAAAAGGDASAAAPGVAQNDAKQQQPQQQQGMGAAGPYQQLQEQQVGSLGSSSIGSRGGMVPDSSSSSASSSSAVPAASLATSPHSVADGSPNALMARSQQQQQQQPGVVADAPYQPAQQQQQQEGQVPQQSPQRQQQQQLQGGSPAKAAVQQQQQPPPASPGKPLTWAQKLKKAEAAGASGPGGNGPSAAAAAAGSHTAGASWGNAGTSGGLLPASSSSGPRIAPAPKSELTAAAAAAGAAGGSSRGSHRTTGQALLAAAKQQEEEAAAAAAAAVPTYSEAAALEGLDETTAKAAVTAASRMPLPAKLIQAWRSGMCLGSLIKLLQSQRPDLATAVNDRIKGWLCQDCDRSTAECLVLFVLANLRRDWHMTAKNPGAFLMGLLQHRAALIGGSGLSRKLLETARNFPNVAVYIDSDVLQELGDMEPELRGFVMDEYMCKQRHDWPEGLKFPSQCLLSCMRSIRYADPAVHRAYIQLLASRPDLSKACNGVILYGLCKCDRGTGLAAVKRLSELPEAWTNAARVNASAFLYQKVQELCGGHGCY